MDHDHALDVTDYVDRRRFNRFNIMVMALSFFVVLIDGYDISVAGFATPLLIKAWNVEPSAFGPVLGASLFGMLFGAPLLGMMGDRYGRKIAIIVSYLLFGVFTLAAARSSSIGELGVLRFVAGIGIGGILPNIVALNAEFAPRRLQATAVIISFTGVPFGGALPGLVVRLLVPEHDWPILFLIGGIIPLVIIPVVALWLPESIRFLAVKDRQAEVAKLIGRMDGAAAKVGPDTRFTVREEKRVPIKYLFSGDLAVMTPLLWLLFALNLMAYFFLANWMPTLLSSVGIDIGQAAIAATVLQFGGVVGSWGIAWPMDRHGMLPVTVLFVLAIPVVGAIGYVGLQSEFHLLAIVFLAGFCTLGLQMGLNAAAAVIYPTALRSTGTGAALGIGRVGSILGPVIGGVLIGMHLAVPTLYMIAATPFAVGAVVSFVLMQLFTTRMQKQAVAEALS